MSSPPVRAILSRVETLEDLPILRDRVERYINAVWWSRLLLLTLLTLGLGVIAMLVYWLGPGRRWTRERTESLRYAIGDRTLEVEAGVWFRQKKSLRIDAIRDVSLHQGPLMRRFGIWSLRVHSVAHSHAIADAQLDGLVDPEGVRKRLLDASRAGDAFASAG